MSRGGRTREARFRRRIGVAVGQAEGRPPVISPTHGLMAAQHSSGFHDCNECRASIVDALTRPPRCDGCEREIGGG